MFDLLQQDILDFRHLDTLTALATTIAGGSAELACLVGSSSARGIAHCIPTSLLLVLVQHAHELRAGRAGGSHPLGPGMEHHQPVIMALECLYAVSLHFDLRVVQTSDGGFVEALAEYASFLQGYLRHQARAPIAEGCLARLLSYTPTSAPPLDPRPPPIETESEQSRRLLVYVHSLQLARRRVREQRSEQRAQGVGPAVSRADAARQRGNARFHEGGHELAAEAYSEAVAELTGLETVCEAAWSLVLALSNRAEALLRLRRYEEVLEDCTNAWVLLERHEGAFDATGAAGIGEKLARREAACHRGVDAQQRGAARAEAARREAAERARVRSERRRRARQARAARLARERAEAEADAQALGALAAAAAAAQLEEAECHVCLEGADAGPLEDVCGHGHLLHPGCSAVWRDRCLAEQRRAPASHPGPHCPMCKRPI